MDETEENYETMADDHASYFGSGHSGDNVSARMTILTQTL